MVVHARPKISQSFPRGDGVETFEPNFQNRIEIKTERPRENSPEANKIGHLITNAGFFGVGALHFHGRKVDLYFEPPYQSEKFESLIRTETWQEQRVAKPSTVFDEVLDFGVREVGTVARFGIKDMATPFGVPHGFYFIALDLAVWNLKTGEQDFHHIIGVKMPENGEVASAFILKQAIEVPHYSWIRWKKYNTQEELRRKASLSAVDKEDVDDCEDEPDMQDRERKSDAGSDSMDWTNMI